MDLEVSDGTAIDTVSFDITVAELNVAPVADPIADQFPDEGDVVALTATATDIDVPANTLTWTQTGGPGATTGGGDYSVGHHRSRWSRDLHRGPGGVGRHGHRQR